MTHDLRNAIGYRRIPASDPEEQRLRDRLFEMRDRHVAEDTPKTAQDVRDADKMLSDYLWERACKIVAEDRAKHPKAKRNAPVGSEGKPAPIPVIDGLTPDRRDQ